MIIGSVLFDFLFDQFFNFVIFTYFHQTFQIIIIDIMRRYFFMQVFVNRSGLIILLGLIILPGQYFIFFDGVLFKCCRVILPGIHLWENLRLGRINENYYRQKPE